ncbi:MAG: FecR family protein [Candidatus Dechloromonas phosphoritropha]
MALCMHQGLTLGWSMLPQWFKAGGVLVLCFALGGCASITLNAVQDGQLVAAGPISGVEVVRQGVRTQPQPNMGLEPGDEIRTGPQSTVVLSFVDGARVIVQPATHVRVGSIFVYLGEVLVKVKGYFAVETRYATAGSEGTQYLVRVDPGDQVKVVVAEDRVGLVSRHQRWNKAILAAGQSALIIGEGAPRIGDGPVSPAKIEEIRERIRALDALVPQPANVSPLVAGGVAVGAGIGLGWLLNKGKHKDDTAHPTSVSPQGHIPQDQTLPPSGTDRISPAP